MEELPSELSGIFFEALSIPDLEARDRFLDKACEGDLHLREMVSEMINAQSASSKVFAEPFAVLPEIASSRNPSTIVADLPKEFGNFILEKILGQGGMGVVYRAKQPHLGRTVALKMIRSAHFATRQEVQRFHAEAQAAAGLLHPGIVPVFESGKIEDRYFFTMPYIEGLSLAEAVKTGRLLDTQKLFISKHLAEAIAYAHQQGIIDRDLKPENILLSLKGTKPTSPSHYQPHISDFGLAKSFAQNHELTLAGEIIGTPGYMSPEQAMAEHERITEASDVYSLGALIYFIYSGRPPFQGRNLFEILQKVKEEAPPPLTSRSPDIQISTKISL